jgi:PPP family 3-phenylpropionic acid transporter
MLNQGAAMVMLVTFGWLVEWFGAHAFFASTVTCSVGIICVLVSLRLRPPKDATRPAVS